MARNKGTMAYMFEKARGGKFCTQILTPSVDENPGFDAADTGLREDIGQALDILFLI
jgi:hypothetical protein